MKAAIRAADFSPGRVSTPDETSTARAPVRASVPFAVVGECQGADWGAKDVEGRELRLSISLQDAGETTARLAGLMARVDPAVRTAADAGDGWRIVTARLVRSRVARTGGKG